jgi:LuxR family maltose regulon positive regulatory protein
MCSYTNVYDFDVYFKKLAEYCDKSPFTEFGPSTSQSIGSWVIIAGESRAGAPEDYIEAAPRSIPYVSHALNGNMYGFDDLARGELCYFRREINDAEKHLKQALDKARSRNQYDIQARALFYLMHVDFARGNFAAANATLESMKDLLDVKDYLVRYTTYDVACGFYYLALGQPEQIPGWLKGDFSPYTHPALLDNYANRVRAHYHYQTRKYGILLAFIENERSKQTALFGKIGINIIAALSLYQLKRRNEAIIELTEAYELAEPNNIITPFIQYGRDMRTLTAAALKDGRCPIPNQWLENINRKSSAFAKRKTHMIAEYKKANNIENGISLTKRETDVLKDLTQGFSRTEIAASHNISVNTVKMVINIIYDKLYVHNLADAIRVSVEQKII